MRTLTALFLFTACLLFSEPLFAQFAGGTGTADDPFQVETLEQLQEIQNHIDSHFILINDIDASETSNWNDGEGFIPIGNPDTPFTGTFEGNGHEITGFRIFRGEEIKLPRDYLGLFGYLEGAEIKNLTMSKLRISAGLNTMYVGGIAGYTDHNSIISNISIEGSVSPLILSGTATKRYFGGIAGINTGMINNSRFIGKTGTTVGHYFGGIAGENNGLIEQSFTLADVQAGGYGGGIAGSNTGTIRTSFSFSPERIHGAFAIGGFVGYNSGTILNSFSHSRVTGGTDGSIGGFIARNSGTIASSFSTGEVQQNAVGRGGFAARNNEGTITGSYWDAERSGMQTGIEQGDSSGLTGLATSQMAGNNAAQFMGALDFMTIWQFTDLYPALQWQGDALIYNPDIDIDEEEPEETEPKAIELLQNYPNPFNVTTTIHFMVHESVDNATFTLYNAAGQKVRTMYDGPLYSAEYQIPIDFISLPSGHYFLRVSSTANTELIQMTLIK